MPQASSAPTQSSTSSQMPSASSSAVQSPPQTPTASLGFRHSRNRRQECLHIHNHKWRQAVADASVEPPTHSSTSSQMPSASASAVQSPPQTPRTSSWLPSQSQSPSGCPCIRTRRSLLGRCKRHKRRVRPRIHLRRRRCHPHRRRQHSHRHIRPRRRAGYRRTQSPSGMSAHPHSKISPGRYRRRKRRAHPRNRRCHRRCHPASSSAVQSPPHTPRRRAGFRHSRSRRQGCPHSRKRRSRQDRCKCRKRQAIQRIHLRRRRCHPHRRLLRSHRHTRPRRRVGCHHSRSRLRGCQHIRTRRLSWAVADATSVELTHAVVHIVTDAIGVSVRSAFTATHAEGVELVAITVAVAFWDVIASALVDLSWALQTPQASSAPTHHLRRRRCRHCLRPPCSHRHTRPRRRAGFRHSRSRLRMSAHPHS